jgi:streptogrisin C
MTPGKLRRLFAAGAAAGVLAASGYAAGPVWGSDQPDPSGQSAAVADSNVSALSEPALEEAVLRDLHMTPAEFAAAGEQGVQAAAVAAELSDIPGYLGIRMQGGQVLVSGSGAELRAKVAALSVGPSIVLLDVISSTGTDAEELKLAVSAQQLFRDYLLRVGPKNLQGVSSSSGKFVIRTASTARLEPGESPLIPPGKITAAEFVAGYANVELDDAARLVPEMDVLGGEGYSTDLGEICSTGYSVFDPVGLPAVLTAGHCSNDGTARTANLKSPGTNDGAPLGAFGFSQFGGPDNSTVLNPSTPTNPGNVGTDVAVLESVPSEVNPQAASTTWGASLQSGPDVKIIGTASPVVGMPVCRSGWASGWSCGFIDEVGVQVVTGPSYASDETDVRAFDGFLSFSVQSSGGDSGGPWISGNYAVGLHAAGEQSGQPNRAVAATLEEALAVLPGYQLEVFLNKPVATSPAAGATYEPGQAISGNVPAAPATAVAAESKVRITIQGEAPFEVPVNADGTWSFPAPQTSGTLRFTAETVNGFSTSGASSFEFEKVAPAEPAPPVPPAPGGPAPVEPAAQEPIQPAPAPVPAEPAPADPAPAVPAPAVPPAPAEDPAAVVVLPPVSAPADLANTSGNWGASGNLAATGANALVPAALAAAAAIVVGGALMVLVRRRRQPTRG